MRYVGIDHGSRAFRVAIVDPDAPSAGSLAPDTGGRVLRREFPREKGVAGGIATLLSSEDRVVMSYSMGDAIDSFVPCSVAPRRGVRSDAGAGRFVGAGASLVDLVSDLVASCHLAPGLHRDVRSLDPRFRTLYSHCGSGENVLAAFHTMVTHALQTFVLADVSTNTVSLLVREGRVVGGIDAALGAPGLHQGPLDLDAIRAAERLGAGAAFDRGGVLERPAVDDAGAPPVTGSGKAGCDDTRLDALALAVAMEIAGLLVLGDVEAVVLTGWGPEENPCLVDAIADHLGLDVLVTHRFSAAEGGALAALAIHEGAGEILGIPVVPGPDDV